MRNCHLLLVVIYLVENNHLARKHVSLFRFRVQQRDLLVGPSAWKLYRCATRGSHSRRISCLPMGSYNRIRSGLSRLRHDQSTATKSAHLHVGHWAKLGDRTASYRRKSIYYCELCSCFKGTTFQIETENSLGRCDLHRSKQCCGA
jgi:hypothetical protein